jgi:hypothetical protein
MANVCLAAGDVPDTPDTQDIVALLREIEHQVSAGHAISPEESCGMQAWEPVVLSKFAAPPEATVTIVPPIRSSLPARPLATSGGNL